MAHLSEVVTPGTFIATAIDPKAGDVVVIFSRGRFRTAEVTGTGPKRIQTEYVTRQGGTTTKRPQPRGEVYRSCFGDDVDLVGVVRQRPGRGGQYLED